MTLSDVLKPTACVIDSVGRRVLLLGLCGEVRGILLLKVCGEVKFEPMDDETGMKIRSSLLCLDVLRRISSKLKPWVTVALSLSCLAYVTVKTSVVIVVVSKPSIVLVVVMCNVLDTSLRGVFEEALRTLRVNELASAVVL